MIDTSADEISAKDKAVAKKAHLETNQLGTLYPRPKTYDNRMQDQAAREMKLFKRQSRFLSFSTATRLFVIVGAISLLLTFAPILVAWNVISGVFNIVLCIFILVGLIKWQFSEIASAVYNKGINDTTFLTLYSAAFAPLTGLILYQANVQANILLTLPLYVLVFFVHFLCVKTLIHLLSQVK